MTRVRAFQPQDLASVDLQPVQEWIRPHLTLAYGIRLARDPAFTLLDADQIIACGGIARFTDARPLLWSLVSRHARPHFLALHRVAQRLIACYDEPGLCATCEPGHEQGRRWLELLGFRPEGSLPNFGPDSSTHDLYGRAC